MRPAAFIPAASGSSSCTYLIPSSRHWIQERMESAQQEPVDRSRILDQLVRADIFEQTIHSRYIGTKRYSLEGNTALIPLLDEILTSASDNGAEQAVLAMSHRGRLNVIINIVSRPAAEIFAGFEDVDPRSVLGGGDVKYHIGATGIVYGSERQTGSHSSGVQPQPPGGGRSGGAGSRARQADSNRARRQVQGATGFDARRFRVCGAGNHRRDAESRQLARLHRRRHGARHRQQPHRIHD